MTNHTHKLKVRKKQEQGHYRFGTGIELIDNNILSGPDIERVVNFKPEDEKKK